jgi:hypothetical protein
MVHPTVPESLLQGQGDVLLADDLLEGVGPIAAIERERHVAKVSADTDIRTKKELPCTRQSTPTLAAVKPWGS